MSNDKYHIQKNLRYFYLLYGNKNTSEIKNYGFAPLFYGETEHNVKPRLPMAIKLFMGVVNDSDKLTFKLNMEPIAYNNYKLEFPLT